MRDRLAARAAMLAVLSAALLARGAVPAAALDLAKVPRDVAAANPTLAASDARVESARRRVASAGAWSSPMLELGATNVPTNGRFDEEPMTMKMIGVSQRVPVFGANGLRAGAASQATRAAAADADLARYEAYGAAWEAYADLFHATALARHAAAHRSIMDRLVEAARARYAAGRGRLDDVLRSEAERARMQADIAAFDGEADEARARLDALRGRSRPAGVIDATDAAQLAPPPDPDVPPTADAWLAAIDDAQPRLRRFEARAASRRLDARATRRAVWPDLELRGSYGFREPLRNGATPDDMFSVSVGFMLPLFAGGNQLADAAAMDAMARASEADLDAARLDLTARVRAFYAAAQASERLAGILADTVVVVQERALEASHAAYEAGTTDLWRVFEASHALYQERTALERARQQHARALAGMLALTGRGDLVGVALPEPGRSTR